MLKGRYQLIKGYQDAPVTVGFGSYGQVKLGKDKQTGQMVAIKIINKLAKNQVVFHNRLTHHNIIQLLSYQVDRERQITYMVLEYADGGTLFQKIKSNSMNKSQIRKYFQDVCHAIDYLHSKQIMHRDIKPQNILLTKKKEAKLCDFGFAAILGQRMTLCGTYQYMSPEMIQGRTYDYKIDIWALGILLFQMIAGRAPFRGESPQQVLNQMKTKIFFCQKFEQEEIDLIKMILRVTPAKRPNMKDILGHTYFNQEVNSTKASSETSQNSNSKKKNSQDINSNVISMKKQKHGQTFGVSQNNQLNIQQKNSANSSNTNISMNKGSSGGFMPNENNSKNIDNNLMMKAPTNSYPFYNPSKNNTNQQQQQMNSDPMMNMKAPLNNESFQISNNNNQNLYGGYQNFNSNILQQGQMNSYQKPQNNASTNLNNTSYNWNSYTNIPTNLNKTTNSFNSYQSPIQKQNHSASLYQNIYNKPDQKSQWSPSQSFGGKFAYYPQKASNQRPS